MRAFWDQDRGGRNFGDALTAVLFERLAEIPLEWSSDPELFGSGSLAEGIPPGFSGWVFGTGKMFSTTQLDLSAARVLALRGVLTAEGSGADCTLLADPGLLAADLAQPADKNRELGVIPHYVDQRSFAGAYRIDVLAGVDQVIAEAACCERIISSSLHGLILADALGIPNRWEPHPDVMGDGFKFRDYASSYGEVIQPGLWRLADQEQVYRKRNGLRAALMTIKEAL